MVVDVQRKQKLTHILATWSKLLLFHQCPHQLLTPIPCFWFLCCMLELASSHCDCCSSRSSAAAAACWVLIYFVSETCCDHGVDDAAAAANIDPILACWWYQPATWLQISSPVAAAAATTKYSSSQLQKPSTKKQQKTGDNGLMVMVIPRLNPCLVLSFPSHAQFEPIFGPLFSASCPVVSHRCSLPFWTPFWSSVFSLMPSFFS